MARIDLAPQGSNRQGSAGADAARALYALKRSRR